jgi:hypothetical protein
MPQTSKQQNNGCLMLGGAALAIWVITRACSAGVEAFDHWSASRDEAKSASPPRLAALDNFERSQWCVAYHCKFERSWPLRSGATNYSYGSTDDEDVSAEIEIKDTSVVGLGVELRGDRPSDSTTLASLDLFRSGVVGACGREYVSHRWTVAVDAIAGIPDPALCGRWQLRTARVAGDYILDLSRAAPPLSPSPPGSSLSHNVGGTNVPFTVTRSWDMRGKGTGRVIVIAPSHVNAADMRVLGNILHADAAHDQLASVFVYDNDSIASKHDWLLSQDHEVPEDHHFVGHYLKSLTTNEWRFFLDGMKEHGRDSVVSY